MMNIYKYGEYQIGISLLAIYSSLMFLHINPWAWLVLAASVALLSGTIINGRWRYSPWLRLLGSLANALTIGILSMDYPILSGVAIFCSWFVFLNVSDVKNV